MSAIFFLSFVDVFAQVLFSVYVKCFADIHFGNIFKEYSFSNLKKK